MTREIELSKGKVAVVDDCDYELLSMHKWHARKGGNTWYAERDGISMHRQIMDAPKGLQVDHVDRNGLNNTRANLRLATRAQNGHNSIRSVATKASAYKGVWRHGNKWRASVFVNNGRINLGTFESEAEAAHAYNEGAKKYHGEFAYLNDVGPQPERAPRLAPWVDKYGLSAPYGECQCGCGRNAQVARRTIRRLGYLKGMPMRFAIGHRGYLGRFGK